MGCVGAIIYLNWEHNLHVYLEGLRPWPKIAKNLKSDG